MPTASMPASMATARPTGVTILAILYFLGGAFGLLFGVLAIAIGGAIGSMIGDAFGAMGAIIGAAIGAFMILFGVIGLVVGYGLWTRKTWGWWVALVFAAFSVLSSLLSLMGGDIFSAIFGLAIQGFIIWYMTSPGVQAWFGTSIKAPWHKTA